MFGGVIFFGLVSVSPCLGIMLVSPEITTCPVLHMVQMSALSSCNDTISFAPAFSSANVSLVVSGIRCFSSRKFTARYTLMNPFTLIGPSLVYTLSLRLYCYHEAQSEAR